MQSKPLLGKKTRTTPPTPPSCPCGWHPQHTTYTTQPINPDLDAVPTGFFEITYYPTSLESMLLHMPNGRLISLIIKSRLHKLNMMYHSCYSTTTLPEAIADIILRHKVNTYKETFTKER
jgi:hypothetical protein